MKKTLLWVLAVLVGAGTMVYQRMTGPTYEKRGEIAVGATKIAYRLPRSSVVTSDAVVALEVPDAAVAGTLSYKRYPTDDPWTDVPLERDGAKLKASIPAQPMAGKVAYKVVLTDGANSYPLNGGEPVVLRFRGEVPVYVVIPHVLFMLLAMVFSAKAGIEAVRRGGRARAVAQWAAVFLFLSGFILGPLMQWFGFHKLWTGFPLGHDLTDNKTMVAMIGWIVVLFAARKGRPARGWILAAALLTLVVFLIPHSLLGSELDYSKLGR